jgi:uncharacterized membrane protein
MATSVSKRVHDRTYRFVLVAILAAIILVMGFTPLGYLNLGPIAITLLMIPVAIGAIVAGPAAGALLGLVFGLTAIVQCFGINAMGTFCFNYNWWGTIIQLVVSRVLMGFLVGCIYRGLSRVFANLKNRDYVSFVVASLCAAFLNTLFYVTCFVLFFGNSDMSAVEGVGINMASLSLFDILSLFITVNAVVELIVCGIVGTAIGKVLVHYLPKQTA